jgi:single-strand DNA-binding protein
MYHKVTIIGRLGNDPELRYSPTGRPVTHFSVAANRRYTSADGSMVDETVWFRCTAWNKQAETINQYLSKGQLVYVEGRLSPDKETGGPRVWSGQNGQARAGYEVVVERIKFLWIRGEGAGPSAPVDDIEAFPDADAPDDLMY